MHELELIVDGSTACHHIITSSLSSIKPSPSPLNSATVTFDISGPSTSVSLATRVFDATLFAGLSADGTDSFAYISFVPSVAMLIPVKETAASPRATMPPEIT